MKLSLVRRHVGSVLLVLVAGCGAGEEGVASEELVGTTQSQGGAPPMGDSKPAREVRADKVSAWQGETRKFLPIAAEIAPTVEEP